MNEILLTKFLEYEKSTFLIDLVKIENQKYFIQLAQTIRQPDKVPTTNILKINQIVLKEIINTLNTFQESIEEMLNHSTENDGASYFLSEKNKTEIQNRYLRGVSIAELAVQFDCNENLLEQILRNKDIAIVNQKIPYWLSRRKFWKRNKYK